MKKIIPFVYLALLVCLTSNGFAQTSCGPLVLDTKPPQVTLTAPNSGTFSMNEVITVSWTATDDNIASHGVTIGIWDEDMEHFFPLVDELINDGTESISLDHPVTNGKIRVLVRDKMGNSGSAESSGLITVNGGYVLSGYVRDENTYQPIEDAVVSASMQRSLLCDSTDNQGYFEISNMPAGLYVVTALKQGYSSDTKTIELNGSSIMTLFLHQTGNNNCLVINDSSFALPFYLLSINPLADVVNC